MTTATFGAGCFWGVEARFAEIPGVTGTAVGYMGGQLDRPSYEEVCTGRTDHAEVVQVEYDPARVSYGALVEAFFSLHDPTTLNRQGPDRGTQYRSVIFHYSAAQEAEAKAVIARLTAAQRFPRPIVTQVVAHGPFWRAEEYHQKYFEKRGGGGCHL